MVNCGQAAMEFLMRRNLIISGLKNARRGQAAMEFLMTYGYAILVVFLVIGAISYFGFINTDSLLPERCSVGSNIHCQDFYINSVENIIGIRLLNNQGHGTIIYNISAKAKDLGFTCENETNEFWDGNQGIHIPNAGSSDFILQCPPGVLEDLEGHRSEFTIDLSWYSDTAEENFMHFAAGELLAFVAKESIVPVCGNSIIEPGEQCDDGNLNNNDDCLNSCVDASCGDTFVFTGIEQCDDGNVVSGDGCSSVCQIELPSGPVCGNGILEGSEQCDDGNLVNGDGCDDTCNVEALTRLFEAELLALSGGYGSSTSCICTSPSNGLCARDPSEFTEGRITIASFPEASLTYDVLVRYCDENDDVVADDYRLLVNGVEVDSWQSVPGGSNQWVDHVFSVSVNNGDEVVVAGTPAQAGTYARVDYLEFTSTSAPPAPVCGNGVLESGEQCDDGNTVSGDGCSSTCQTEQVGSVDVRVLMSSDDAEEDEGGGSVSTGSSDLELVLDAGTGSGLQTVGIRFQNVDIPVGATITSAVIEFTQDEDRSGNVDLVLRAQAVDNPSSFTSASGSISSRPQTIALVNWPITARWSSVSKQQTPDLSALVQEVVSRPGWSANNALVFIITGSSTSRRVAESWNGASGHGDLTRAPRLLIQYTTGAPPAPVCGNNMLESGEQCDDGNLVSGDGCSSACQNELLSGPFQESGGRVVMEAENYDVVNNPGANGDSWVLEVSQAGYSGSGYMSALPDDGTNQNTGYVANSPELEYQVNFATTGTYYVWLRGYSVGGAGDSVHAGIDDTGPGSADRINNFVSGSWSWRKITMDGPDASVVVGTAGVHKINVWEREDGFRLDKILLTTDSGFTPSGSGPAESSRGGSGGSIETLIDFSGFESGVQGWTFGGGADPDGARSNARDFCSDVVCPGTGSWSAHLQDDNVGNSLFSKAFDFGGYDVVDVLFWYYPNSIDGGEFVTLQCDGNEVWRFTSGDETQGNWYEKKVSVSGADCVFDASVVLEFTGVPGLSGNADDLWVDGIDVTGIIITP